MDIENLDVISCLNDNRYWLKKDNNKVLNACKANEVCPSFSDCLCDENCGGSWLKTNNNNKQESNNSKNKNKKEESNMWLSSNSRSTINREKNTIDKSWLINNLDNTWLTDNLDKSSMIKDLLMEKKWLADEGREDSQEKSICEEKEDVNPWLYNPKETSTVTTAEDNVPYDVASLRVDRSDIMNNWLYKPPATLSDITIITEKVEALQPCEEKSNSWLVSADDETAMQCEKMQIFPAEFHTAHVDLSVWVVQEEEDSLGSEDTFEMIEERLHEDDSSLFPSYLNTSYVDTSMWLRDADTSLTRSTLTRSASTPLTRSASNNEWLSTTSLCKEDTTSLCKEEISDIWLASKA